MMNKRLANIDFLRFLFACILCLMHLCTGLGTGNPLWSQVAYKISTAQILTDFFFIASGFFLMNTNPAVSFQSFIQKKIVRLWPVLAFSGLCYFVLSFYKTFKFDFLEQISMLLFVNSLGFFSFWGYTAWFTSVLFFASLFYFALRQNINSNSKFYFLTAGLIIVSYSTLISHYQGVGGNFQVLGIASAGMWRAIGGMGIGIIIHKFVQYDISFLQEKSSFWLLGLAETCLLGLVGYLLVVPPQYPGNNFVFILIFTALFILFVKQRGFLSRGLNRDIFSKGGKISYSLYMMHYPLMFWIASFFWYRKANMVQKHPFFYLFLAFVVILAISIFVYYFIEKSNRYRKVVVWGVCFLIIPPLIQSFLPLKYHKTYLFNRSQPQINLTNVSNIDWARWTVGPEVSLSFTQQDEKPSTLELSLAPYINEQHQKQTVEAWVNGSKQAQWVFVLNKPYPHTELLLGPSKKQQIILKLHNTASPKSLNLGPDERALGVAFVSLKLTNRG